MKKKTKRPRRSSSSRKKSKGRDFNRTRAYWVGVGISAGVHGQGDRILNGKYGAAAYAGYSDNSLRDVSRKVR